MNRLQLVPSIASSKSNFNQFVNIRSIPGHINQNINIFQMPLWRLFYHLVWATHERQPLISPLHEKILYPYIKGKADFLECQLHAIGGIEDHIHLIVSIPPKLSISDFAKRIKGSSCRYLNQEFAEDSYTFAWQHEYAVFSLGEQRLEWAIAYVENQKQHHATGKLIKVLEQTEPG
jgi:putative transposase